MAGILRGVAARQYGCAGHGVDVHKGRELMTDCSAGVRAQVVFPVLAQLSELKGTLEGVERSQLRSSMLVSKLFTHHLDKLSVLPEFADLWLKMLKFMEIVIRKEKKHYRWVPTF